MQEKPLTIMELLRQETESAHTEIENLPFSQAILNNNLPIALYVGLLEALLPVHRVIENYVVASDVHPKVAAIWQADMAKLPLLQADLKHLPTDIPSAKVQQATAKFIQAIEQAEKNQPLSLLGTLYVLEGSMLGAQTLLPHLQKTLNLTEEGLQYYHGYRDQTQNHWQAYKTRMNNTITQPEQQQIVLDGAQQTFANFKNLLKALWLSRA